MDSAACDLSLMSLVVSAYYRRFRPALGGDRVPLTLTLYSPEFCYYKLSLAYELAATSFLELKRRSCFIPAGLLGEFLSLGLSKLISS